MKKKIIGLILVGLFSFNFIGCGEDKVNKSTNTTGKNRFINTGDSYFMNGWEYHVVYDYINEIVYLQCDGSQTSGVTEFIGKDKLPMTLDEYNATK